MARRDILDTTGATTVDQVASTADGASLKQALPGIVLVHGPEEGSRDDRAPLGRRLSVGRSSTCGFFVRDRLLSREHFLVTSSHDGLRVQDLGSRNGVFVDGQKVSEAAVAQSGSVIRAGNSVFVIVADLWALGPSQSSVRGGIAGRFSAAQIEKNLKVAARTGHPVLLVGESGTGKELAAERLHQLYQTMGRGGELVVHNAAFFAGEDDAVATLFGVTKGAFTGVEPRRGAFEQAQAGTFFLDEAHALPLRVQRALLRFVEDRLVQPLGQGPGATKKAVDARLVFGTNVDVEEACRNQQLAHDLVARLFRVTIPPLRSRRADIPSIFESIVQKTAGEQGSELLAQAMTPKAVEKLCLHDYRQGNVRELVKVAAVAAARVAERDDPKKALAKTLEEMVGGGSLQERKTSPAAPVQSTPSSSTYEQHRAEILAVYEKVGGNLSKMVELLHADGIKTSRRWLAEYLGRWGVRPVPRRK